MKCPIFKLFTLLLFLQISLFANQTFIEKVNKLHLDTNPYWLKLLHYENGKSIINNQEFFLSKDGKIDVKKELEKTIKNFTNNPNLICKYPARYKWLKDKIDFQVDETKVTCEKLNKYLEPNFNKLSILFTSERYDSPSSVFGHTFLKLDSKTIPYAINYAAKVPDYENKFLYAYRGITGKYPSGYTLLPFQTKDYEYRAKEFRDLIQFEIKLTQSELENILLHLFEIQNTQQDYYFIGRNCSSELIKLLDIANYDSKHDLSSKLGYPTIPIDIVYILEKKKLILNISKQISKLKLFYSYQDKLDENSKNILSQIIRHEISIQKFDEDTSITFENKKLIILASIAYIEMISASKDFERKHIYSLLKLIKLSHKYNLKSQFNTTLPLKQNPISNRFHKLLLGKRFIKNKANQTLIQYRHLYRNRFDLVDKIQKNGTVEFFDLTLRHSNDKTSIENFKLLNLEAMPISNDFFTNYTKKMSLGAKRLFYSDNLYNYFDYGMGYKKSLTSNINFHILGDIGIYYFKDDVYQASLENSFEYLYQTNFISELKFEYNTYSNGVESKNIYLNNHIKVLESSNLSFNIEYKKDLKEYTNFVFKYSFLF